MHGAEWKVVVDNQKSRVKFLRKDEFEKGMADALSPQLEMADCLGEIARNLFDFKTQAFQPKRRS
jgi:hypothetical protein